MWYAQVQQLPSPADRKQLIEEAMNRKNWTQDNLIDKLGFPYRSRGYQALGKLFSGEDNRQLLRRIAKHLDIPSEQLTGERAFEQKLDHRKFTFVPTLVKVPASTRPQQIMPVAMFGVDRFLHVDRYPQLLHANEHEQDQLMAKVIPENYAENDRTIFGAITGYALYYAFGKARGYAVNGERMEHVEVHVVSVGTSVNSGSRRLGDGKGSILRLVDQTTVA